MSTSRAPHRRGPIPTITGSLFTRLSTTALAAGIVAGGAVICGPSDVAGAFAEDICYSKAGVPATNCASLPPGCTLQEPTTAACRADAATRVAVSGARPGSGRSLIHSDATYIMAHAIGFSTEDAYWIAAYDEATDLGSFAPTNIDGTPAPNAAALTTADVGGLVRTNFATGGLLYHFVAPMKDSSNQQPDGLHPDVDDAKHEVMLAHVRRWALAGPGSAVPLCTGGFTVESANGDYATGASCYGGADSVPVRGLLSLESPIAIPFATRTGLQIISGDVRSDQFDSWTGGNSRAADARTGVYLHVLGDRISHHRCTDASQIEPPAKTHEGFREDMNNDECNQGTHALRHLYETGVLFNQLDAADQTTSAALPMIYDELVTFARARNSLNPKAATAQAKRDLIDGGLIPALQTPEGVARMTAVTAVGCRLGIPPFPGAPKCGT